MQYFYILFSGVSSFLLSETDGRGYVEIKKIPSAAEDPCYDTVSIDETVKVVNLEKSQEVKFDENEVEDKIYEPMSAFSISRGPQANSSFLWNNQIKNPQCDEKSSTLDRGKEVDLNENTYEEFDDVGTPFEVINLFLQKILIY